MLGALRHAGAFNRTPAVHRWLREDGIPVGEVLGAQLLSCYAATGSGSAAEGVLREMEAGEGAWDLLGKETSCLVVGRP